MPLILQPTFSDNKVIYFVKLTTEAESSDFSMLKLQEGR